MGEGLGHEKFPVMSARMRSDRCHDVFVGIPEPPRSSRFGPISGKPLRSRYNNQQGEQRKHDLRRRDRIQQRNGIRVAPIGGLERGLQARPLSHVLKQSRATKRSTASSGQSHASRKPGPTRVAPNDVAGDAASRSAGN